MAGDESRPGTLYLVGTPVGNLEDLSPRAARLLGEVSLVAAEDTRRTRQLLTHLGLRTPLLSYHQHSGDARVEEICRRLESGEDVALVTDAGMPAVSDPGWRLVATAVARGLTVSPVPGPTALILALAGSGLPTASFVFDGFPPRRPGPRRRRLETLRDIGATVVLYESPHRIIATLRDVAAVFGDAPVVVGRELTKLHEEFLRGTASEIAAELEARARRDGRPKGEFTLVIGRGRKPTPPVGDRRRLSLY
ncbi:MAG: 16S rRNA (cytidine(1402)-2'-O)-methyltransferase [Bacillota bacterium]